MAFITPILFQSLAICFVSRGPPRFVWAAQSFPLRTARTTDVGAIGPKAFVKRGVQRLCQYRVLDADHASARVEADLMSTTGVPSKTSIGPIFTRVPSISRTVTGCSPSGFGRAGERV
jgi:hypothetical protein